MAALFPFLHSVPDSWSCTEIGYKPNHIVNQHADTPAPDTTHTDLTEMVASETDRRFQKVPIDEHDRHCQTLYIQRHQMCQSQQDCRGETWTFRKGTCILSRSRQPRTNSAIDGITMTGIPLNDIVLSPHSSSSTVSLIAAVQFSTNPMHSPS